MSKLAKKQKLNRQKIISIVTIVLLGLGLLVIIGTVAIKELFPEKDYSQSQAVETVEYGNVPVEINVTQNINDLPENLRDRAREAEEYIIKAVGKEMYDKNYRIATDRTITCSQTPVNAKGCIAFLYLPPSQHGVKDFFVFFRYENDEFTPHGDAAYCLEHPSTCVFTISQQEAYSIIKSKGNTIDINNLKLYYGDESYWAVPHWEWRTSISQPDSDPYCFTSQHYEVDAVSGLYTTGKQQNCM